MYTTFYNRKQFCVPNVSRNKYPVFFVVPVGVACEVRSLRFFVVPVGVACEVRSLRFFVVTVGVACEVRSLRFFVVTVGVACEVRNLRFFVVTVDVACEVRNLRFFVVTVGVACEVRNLTFFVVTVGVACEVRNFRFFVLTVGVACEVRNLRFFSILHKIWVRSQAGPCDLFRAKWHWGQVRLFPSHCHCAKCSLRVFIYRGADNSLARPTSRCILLFCLMVRIFRLILVLLYI
jgi:hypothetical protein